MKRPAKQQGFTIIELLIATLIFTLVLVVVVAGFLQVGRIFYKGVSISSTQEAARTLTSDITDDLTFSHSVSLSDPVGGVAYTDPNAGGVSYFCIGYHRYTFDVDGYKLTDGDITSQTSPISHKIEGVERTNIPGGCPPPSTAPGSNWQQLLGPDMQLNQLSLKCAYSSFCSINIHIVFYGNDKTVFDTHLSGYKDDPADPYYNADTAPDAFCSGNLLSTQFCATADVNTSINYQG